MNISKQSTTYALQIDVNMNIQSVILKKLWLCTLCITDSVVVWYVAIKRTDKTLLDDGRWCECMCF